MKTKNFLHLFYKTYKQGNKYYTDVFDKGGNGLFTSTLCSTVGKSRTEALGFIMDAFSKEPVESKVSPSYEDCQKVLTGMSTQEQLDTIYAWILTGVISQRTFEKFILRYYRQR